MTPENTALLMVGLDLLMIAYTLWILTRAGVSSRIRLAIGAGLGAWLLALHITLSTGALFPETISGPAFLAVIFAAVGAVGAGLLLPRGLRDLLLGLSQTDLLIFQGIRVFFGATFLMQAAVGVLPQGFGIIDGYTHIGAGFLGLIAAATHSAAPEGRWWLWVANLWGLGDILIVASSLALVLLPEIGPHHGMMYAVFLPAPLWLWAHALSLWKLGRGSFLPT